MPLKVGQTQKPFVTLDFGTRERDSWKRPTWSGVGGRGEGTLDLGVHMLSSFV